MCNWTSSPECVMCWTALLRTLSNTHLADRAVVLTLRRFFLYITILYIYILWIDNIDILGKLCYSEIVKKLQKFNIRGEYESDNTRKYNHSTRSDDWLVAGKGKKMSVQTFVSRKRRFANRKGPFANGHFPQNLLTKVDASRWYVKNAGKAQVFINRRWKSRPIC